MADGADRPAGLIVLMDGAHMHGDIMPAAVAHARFDVERHVTGPELLELGQEFGQIIGMHDRRQRR